MLHCNHPNNSSTPFIRGVHLSRGFGVDPKRKADCHLRAPLEGFHESACLSLALAFSSQGFARKFYTIGSLGPKVLKL